MQSLVKYHMIESSGVSVSLKQMAPSAKGRVSYSKWSVPNVHWGH